MNRQNSLDFEAPLTSGPSRQQDSLPPFPELCKSLEEKSQELESQAKVITKFVQHPEQLRDVLKHMAAVWTRVMMDDCRGSAEGLSQRERLFELLAELVWRLKPIVEHCAHRLVNITLDPDRLTTVEQGLREIHDLFIPTHLPPGSNLPHELECLAQHIAQSQGNILAEECQKVQTWLQLQTPPEDSDTVSVGQARFRFDHVKQLIERVDQGWHGCRCAKDFPFSKTSRAWRFAVKLLQGGGRPVPFFDPQDLYTSREILRKTKEQVADKLENLGVKIETHSNSTWSAHVDDPYVAE